MCPYCRGIFPEQSFYKIMDNINRAEKELRRRSDLTRSSSNGALVSGITSTTTVSDKSNRGDNSHADNDTQTQNTSTTIETPGKLTEIAPRALMQLLYGGRFARFDLLRCIGRLACYLTKWTLICDRRLIHLIDYVYTTAHLRLIGWVGNPMCEVTPHIWF